MESDGGLLVYGYGNPGRQDDGLGILFAERCGRLFEDRPDFRVETDYQLNIEDADLISGFRQVVFADASMAGTSPDGSEIEAGSRESGFYFYRIRPAVTVSFSTHAMAPGSVLALCGELYGRVPECRMMRISGRAWEFNAEPTAEALRNLEKAWEFFAGLTAGL